MFQHTTVQKQNKKTPPPSPQWNSPTLLESITHEKAVCLLLFCGKLKLQSVTLISSKSGIDTHARWHSSELKNWPCFQCYNFTLLKAWWAGWNITHLRYPWKLLSCFNEAQVIFVQVTQLKELIVGVREKLRGSGFFGGFFFGHYAFPCPKPTERLSSLRRR